VARRILAWFVNLCATMLARRFSVVHKYKKESEHKATQVTPVDPLLSESKETDERWSRADMDPPLSIRKKSNALTNSIPQLTQQIVIRNDLNLILVTRF
jgi:hypothetical protein